MTAPDRPRLCEHVLARRHVAGEEAWAVLHDSVTGVVLRLTPLQWTLARCLDGTRDRDGVVLAARRAGLDLDPDDVAGFIATLADHGMLEDGVEEPPEPPQPPDLSRPLSVLPGYRFTCRGEGICCRIFGSILFSPLEAARARVLAGDRDDELFLPVRGTTRTEALAVSMEDGDCYFLESGGACRMHAAGGLTAKPAGCQLFPSRFIDDGEHIRVSVHLECACVVDSLADAEGDPLVPEDAKVRGDLDVHTSVPALPEEIEIAPGKTASRAEVRRWFAELAARGTPPDVAAGYWALGEAVSGGRLTVEALDRFSTADAIDADSVRPWLTSAARHLDQWQVTFSSFRSERDLVRRAIGWLAGASEALLRDCASGSLRVPPIRPDVEAFGLRSDVHGYHFFDMLPLSHALRARAIRRLIARVLPANLPPGARDEPACRDTLTLVEAMFRGHGLDAYARQL